MEAFVPERTDGRGVFVPQSPVEVDALFKNFPGFLGNLKMIATHIAQPAITGGTSRPMAFGVYGRWGAGKSTAAQHLGKLVAAELETAGVSGALSMSYYSAPQWENTSNALATLSYTILDEIDRDVIFRAVRDESDPIVGDDGWAPRSFVRLAEMFDTSPALYQQWMNQISLKLHPKTNGPNRAHVVFIDDIDRCSPRFTAELLAATSVWDSPGNANIFFVIAASKSHLLDSLDANLPLGVHTAEEALEKYIHLSVTVPKMLSGPRQVAEYLIDLCNEVTSPSTTSSHRRQLEDLLHASSKTYPNCVMAPLLAGSSRDGDEEWLTPRSVKHRFNTFLAEFQPHGDDLVALNVKRWVVKAFWPDFWWQWIWPLEGETIQWSEIKRDVDLLSRLIEFGETLLPMWGLGDEQLRPAFEHLVTRSGLPLVDIDPSVAMYLAAEPRFVLPGPSDSAPITDPPADPTSDGPAASEESPEMDILLRRIQAEQARDEGRLEDAQHEFDGIAELAGSTQLGESAAPTVGNAALVAEQLLLSDIARVLHLRAYELDPTHYNVVQNLVQFIIDSKQEELYGMAEDLLEALEGPGRDHKPHRTLGLDAQFAILTAPSENVRKEGVERFIRWAQSDLTNEALARVLSLGDDLISYDQARDLARRVTERAEDDGERYSALRMLADFLSRSDDPNDEREAMDIYVYVMRTGLACREDGRQANDVSHNMATLYTSFGYLRTAVDIWGGIYLAGPMEQRMRRGFAVALNGAGEDKAAAAVLQGQPLPDFELEPDQLPARFAPKIDHWWERLPIAQYAPCEMPGRTQPHVEHPQPPGRGPRGADD